MRIYPAIDIKDGHCVRLLQGNYNDLTVYGENPEEVAVRWEQAGAEYLHTVDLDGARSGQKKNMDIVARIAKKLAIPVQLGGGIRTMQDIDFALSTGIQRVILGTSAVQNPHLVQEAVRQYGARIVVGIDAREGYVAIEGWEKTSTFTAVEFAKKVESMGVKTIIYTDIATDGMLKGPNLAAMKEMAEAVHMDVIASGGVSSTEDVINLRRTGVEGVIIGKALYTGNVDLKAAIAAVG